MKKTVLRPSLNKLFGRIIFFLRSLPNVLKLEKVNDSQILSPFSLKAPKKKSFVFSQRVNSRCMYIRILFNLLTGESVEFYLLLKKAFNRASNVTSIIMIYLQINARAREKYS